MSQHHAHLIAAQRQHELMQAIHQRGQELRLPPDQVVEAMDAANAELRNRGWHPDQIPFGDPIDDHVRGIDTYDEY